MKVSTIGFAKKSAQQFSELLRESGAKCIVDVRHHNASQLAGFAKKTDLAWFARGLCGIDYVHVPSLAPTKELLSEYRQGHISWDTYETRFNALMKERRTETELSREDVSDGCLLCSEDQPHHRYRRLVADCLNRHWGGLEVEHLGMKNGEPCSASFTRRGQPDKA